MPKDKVLVIYGQKTMRSNQVTPYTSGKHRHRITKQKREVQAIKHKERVSKKIIILELRFLK